MHKSLKETSKTLKKPSVIELKDVNVDFGDVVALKNINLDIKRGTLLYIVGPNGSGKTTFVRLLTNLLVPTKGEIIRGDDVLGYLPQKLNQNPNFPITVEEAIYSGFAKQSLFINKKDSEKIQNWLDKMQIGHLRKKPMAHLSGGQQQRVYLIRALINDPDLIILDEPTSALDPSFRAFFNEVIMDLHHQNKTIIFVTHDLHDTLCDCAHVLYIDQEVRFFGTLPEYYTKEHTINHV